MQVLNRHRLSVYRRYKLLRVLGIFVSLLTMYTAIEWFIIDPLGQSITTKHVPWTHSIAQKTFKLWAYNHSVYSHRDMVNMVLGEQDGATFIKGLQDSSLPFSVRPPNPGGYIINNPGLCETTNPLLYLLFVYSAPHHFDRREVIRATWAKDDLFKQESTRHIFLLGRTSDSNLQMDIEKENNISHDIIQADFTDSYSNLTYKSLLALRWSREHCHNAKYLVKSDDDLFVDMTQIYKVLQVMAGQTRFIVGYIGNGVIHRGNPMRRKNLPDHFFPRRLYYPAYFHGSTYLFSADIAKELYEVAQKTPFFPIDDVYFTGILGGQLYNVNYIRYKGSELERSKLPTFPKFSKKIANMSEVHRLWSLATDLIHLM